ncbi:bacterial regulatory s, tetR family protein [Mycobacterium xenopi 3993]|nr:bacterial regulatory s, tetR family protein [Mycobacterium xenopi 3993]
MSVAGSARTYGGATHSERRSRRQALLIDAALDLIADGGVGSLTVRGVCSQARLNDRYFYESFRSVDELLLALLDDQITRAFDALLPAIEASPPDPMLRARAAIGTGLGFLGEDSRRARLLIESQATEVLRTRRRDLIKMLAQVMADQGGCCWPDRTHWIPISTWLRSPWSPAGSRWSHSGCEANSMSPANTWRTFWSRWSPRGRRARGG